jgi:hypothetical protein
LIPHPEQEPRGIFSQLSWREHCEAPCLRSTSVRFAWYGPLYGDVLRTDYVKGTHSFHIHCLILDPWHLCAPPLQLDFDDAPLSVVLLVARLEVLDLYRVAAQL